MKKIIRLAYVLIASVLLLNSCDVVEEPYIVGADEAKAILEFSVDTIQGVIDQSQLMVTLDFPAGTDVSHLTPRIVVSTYASVSPASGVAQDFTNPVVYKVAAYDGTTADYQVTAVVHDEENEKSILSFRVEDPACEGFIDEAAKTVKLAYVLGTDVTQLAPTIEVSEGATLSPASGEPQDFTTPVTYTVTAINGSTATYTVSVAIKPTGKTVLLHDYTGVRCVNCPAASEVAHQLHADYEGRLIVMSVHAGSFTLPPVAAFPDFSTDEGTEWYNNNTSNPLGSVNRVKLLAGYALNANGWADAVAEALEEEQTIEVKVTNAFDEASRQLTATVDAVKLGNLEGNLMITVCLIEDNIVGRQLSLSGAINDYVHRDVFRTTLNGVYGESLSFVEDQLVQYSKSFNITLPEEYNADNCYVVAYIYDNSQDMKILQTAIEKVN